MVGIQIIKIMLTKKQRLKLYRQTFLKSWNVEKILETLYQLAYEFGQKVRLFNDKSEINEYNKLCESIGDFEVQIEVLEQKFPKMRKNIEVVKSHKLKKLKTDMLNKISKHSDN